MTCQELSQLISTMFNSNWVDRCDVATAYNKETHQVLVFQVNDHITAELDTELIKQLIAFSPSIYHGS